MPELLRPLFGARLRTDDALPALRLRIRHRLVGLVLAGVRSTVGAAGGWRGGTGARGGAARPRCGVRPQILTLGGWGFGQKETLLSAAQ
jgi:hypothetical protein